MKNFLQLMLLVSFINTSLLADDAETLSNTLWQRTFQNSCSESFTFNPSSKVFTFVSTFGKKMVGYYELEKVRRSQRLKVTFSVRLDNGLQDCFASNYNSTNQTIVNYVWIGENGKALYVATQKKGETFNTYAKTESFRSDTLALVQTYVAQVASNEIQQLQSNLGTKTLQQQIAEMQKKQDAQSMALNQKILEQVRASQINNKNTASSTNSGDWKQYLTSEQLIAQQNLENRLDDERRAQRDEDYLQESYRNEEIQQSYIQDSYRAADIQNDYIQESYIQEQINQDYYNQ